LGVVSEKASIAVVYILHLTTRDLTFFAGRLLVVSPLVTWSFLDPLIIVYVMIFGLICAVGALIGSLSHRQ